MPDVYMSNVDEAIAPQGAGNLLESTGQSGNLSTSIVLDAPRTDGDTQESHDPFARTADGSLPIEHIKPDREVMPLPMDPDGKPNGRTAMAAMGRVGYPSNEIDEWKAQTSSDLRTEGYTNDQINTFFGDPPYDPAPLNAVVDAGIQAHLATETESATKQQNVFTDLLDAFLAGLQGSSAGLVTHGKPTTELPANASNAEIIASGVGSFIGDAPAGLVGAAIGAGVGMANPVTGFAGAVALPTAIRTVMMDKYENGEVKDFKQFWQHLSHAMVETAKGYVEGLAAGKAGQVVKGALAPAGKVPRIASPTARAAAVTSAELGAMVSTGAALEGRMPEPEEFTNLAFIIFGAKGAMWGAKKLRGIYAKTGVTPKQMLADMESDVTITQDIVADNIAIPRAYTPSGKPVPVKVAPEPKETVTLYRGEITPGGKSTLPEYIKDDAGFQEIEKNVRGRWFTDDVEKAKWYVDNAGEGGRITKIEVSKADAEKARVSNQPDSVKRFSKDPESEFFVSKEAASSATEWEPPPFKGGAGGGEGDFQNVPGGPKASAGASGGNAPPSPPPSGTAAAKSPNTPMTLKDAEAKIESQFSIGEGTVKKKLTWKKLYSYVVSEIEPINDAVKEMVEASKVRKKGDELLVSEDPHKLAILTRGNMGRSEAMLEYGTIDFETYEPNGKSLKEILAPLDDDLQGLRNYGAAKRTVELAKRKIDSGFDFEAARIVAAAGKAKYEPIFRDLVDYQNRITQYLRDAEVISRKDYERFTKANKEFLPFYRVMEEMEQTYSRQGGLKTRQPIKGIHGSDRTVIDPLESIIKNTYAYVALAERNAVGKAFLKLANETDDPSQFAKRIPPKLQPINVREDEIRAMLDEFLTLTKHTNKQSSTTTKTTGAGGTDTAPQSKQTQMVIARVKEALTARGFAEGESEQMMRRLVEAESGKVGGTVETIIKEVESTTYVPELTVRVPSEVATLFRVVQEPLKPNEIAVFVKGERQVYELDPDVAAAFKASDAESSNLLMRLLAAPAKTLRAGAVFNPDYIVNNPFRDQLSAFLYSKSGYIPGIDLLKGITHEIGHTETMQKWLRGGGANAAFISGDRKQIQEEMAALLEKTGVLGKAWNLMRHPIDSLRVASELSENGSRLGEFSNAIRKSGKDGKEAILHAAYESRDNLQDFARMGSQMRGLNQISAFSAATIGGLDKFARAWNERKIGVTAKALFAITLPTFYFWWANKDDDRYKESPRWQQDAYWEVLTEDHAFKFRRPFDAGVAFGTIPERLLNGFFTDNPNALRDLDSLMINTMVPNLAPNALVPIFEQHANKSMFSGAPIIPSASEKLVPELQYTEQTTELIKEVTSLIGAFPGVRNAAISNDNALTGGVARALTSPALMENYIRAWSGGLGVYITKALDKVARETGLIPDPPKGPWDLSDIPAIRAFTFRYPSASAQSIQDFYTDAFAAEARWNSFRREAKQGDPQEQQRPEFKASAVGGQLDKMRSAITKLNHNVHTINSLPEEAMDGTQKRQVIDQMYFGMIQIARTGNVIMRQAERMTDEEFVKQ